MSRKLTKRAKMAGLLLSAMAVYAAAFAGTVVAAPDSVVVGTPTNSAPFANPYAAPAFGWQSGDSGSVWAKCYGTLSHPGNVLYNDASASSAKKLYIGVITGVDLGRWNLNASCFVEVITSVQYAPTSPVVVENHRGEATGGVETRGHFGNMMDEAEVVVDSYSATGVWVYNAVGCVGDIYANAGDYTVEASPAPAAGREVASAIPGLIVNEWHFSLACDFFLFCGAAQYIHSNQEEDVDNIKTSVDRLFGSVAGWTGRLDSWGFIAGNWTLIRTHPIP